MRPVHAIRICVLLIGLSIGLPGCAGHRSDAADSSAAPEPARATPASIEREAGLASATPDLVCRFPLRQCFDCRGNLICARQCPECPPPALLAPAELPALAELKPVLETCGAITCGPGLHCCNPTCSLCTPKGVECTQQTCD